MGRRENGAVEVMASAAQLVRLLDLNGEGEIRTPGSFRFIRFQVGRNRPLCHLS